MNFKTEYIKLFLRKYLPKKIVIILQDIVNLYQFFKKNSWFFFNKIMINFTRPNLPDRNKFGTNIHLGCGSINHEAFINIDGFPYPHVHYLRDLRNLSIFHDNSVDLIYASHCLEHFHYSEIKKVLQEWYRVLKKGGILRLSVPDFDLLLKIYYENESNPDDIIPQLLGGQNNKYNFHYMIFNKNNLVEKLNEAGFSSIKRWAPNINTMTTFNDFSNYLKEVNGKKFPVSLNLEAKKIC